MIRYITFGIVALAILTSQALAADIYKCRISLEGHDTNWTLTYQRIDDGSWVVKESGIVIPIIEGDNGIWFSSIDKGGTDIASVYGMSVNKSTLEVISIRAPISEDGGETVRHSGICIDG